MKLRTNMSLVRSSPETAPGVKLNGRPTSAHPMRCWYLGWWLAGPLGWTPMAAAELVVMFGLEVQAGLMPISVQLRKCELICSKYLAPKLQR